MTHQADAVVHVDALADLVAALRERGFCVVGPTVRDGAVVYEELATSADLPIGWTDRTMPARTVSPPRRRRALRLRRRTSLVEAIPASAAPPPLARRAATARSSWKTSRARASRLRSSAFAAATCTRSASRTVCCWRSVVDADYAARREDAFVVAVDCADPGGTCFCVSMGTGPGAEAGFDLALTELLEGEHRFLVRVGSERGAEVLADVPHAAAPTARIRRARSASSSSAAARMGRSLDTHGLRDLLLRQRSSIHAGTTSPSAA